MVGWRPGCVTVLVVIACGDDTSAFGSASAHDETTDADADSRGAEDSPGTGADGFTGAVDESGSTGVDESTTGTSAEPPESSTTEPPVDALCGDGIVEGDEVCDDHNTADGDSCSSDCIATYAVVWTATHDGSAGGDDRYTDVVLGPDGTIHAVGYEQVDEENTQLLLVRYAADGTELATWTWQYEGTDTQGRALALHDSGDLLLLAAAFPYAVVARLGMDDDQIQWATALGDAMSTPMARARFVWSPGGGTRLATDWHVPFLTGVRVVKIDDDGQIVWSIDPVTGPYLDAEVTGTVVADGGETWVLGRLTVGTWDDSVDETHAWRISADGVAIDDILLELHGANDLVTLAGGELVVAGTDGKGQPALARIDATGSLVWSSAIGIEYVGGEVKRLVGQADGFCVAGEHHLDSRARQVGCVDAEGIPIWRDDAWDELWSEANGLVTIEGDVVAVGGVRLREDGEPDAWIRRYTPLRGD